MSQPLLRAFSKKNHAESFLKGDIILKSISYYRGELPPRGDKHELIIKFLNGGASLSNPVTILCFHAPYFTQDSQYGCHMVKIHDADALLSAIKEKIGCCLHSSLPSIIKPIEYCDVLDCCPRDSSEIAFFKNTCFKKDEEWRMAFFMKEYKHFENIENVEFKFFKRALHMLEMREGKFINAYETTKIAGKPISEISNLKFSIKDIKNGKINKGVLEEGECWGVTFNITKEEYSETVSHNYGDDLFYEIHLKNVPFEGEIISQK